MLFRNAARNLYLVEALAELMGLLQNHGIRAIAYKGPVLATTLYGNSALRWAGDLDLLVHPSDFSNAKILLAANSYKTNSSSQWHVSELVHQSCQISLDLHRNVVPRRYRFSLSFDDMWERRRSLSLTRSVSVVTSSLKDLLVILSLELIKEFAQPAMLRLIRITDISVLLQENGIINCNLSPSTVVQYAAVGIDLTQRISAAA
jgi:hypothetical protein